MSEAEVYVLPHYDILLPKMTYIQKVVDISNKLDSSNPLVSS